jgi:hypothetical protein
MEREMTKTDTKFNAMMSTVKMEVKLGKLDKNSNEYKQLHMKWRLALRAAHPNIKFKPL